MGKSCAMKRIFGFKQVKVVLRDNIDWGASVQDKVKGLMT